MGRNLSNISTIATEETNTTGVLDPILKIEPKDGTRLVFKPGVARGSEMGIPIYAELKDSNDDDLPQDTTIALQYEAPTDDNRSTVSEPKTNIRTYRTLSLKDQQNEDYTDSVKHELKGTPPHIVRDVDEFYVSIESSAQIDWSNSQLNFEEKAVEEV